MTILTTSKRIIIHAGLPKTASTFLQENVFPLLPKTDCCYNPEGLAVPLTEMCKRVAARGELSSSELIDLKHKVDDEISRIKNETLLISIEGFLPVHCGGIVTGRNIFKVLGQLFDNATIIIFLREQSAWLRSAYSFYLVTKCILPFEEFVNKTADGSFGERSPRQLGVCVYDYAHQSIKNVAQSHFDTVLCFSFEELFSKQEAVLEALAKIIGVTKLSVRNAQVVNKGLDERLMVIVSRVARRIPFHAKWSIDYLYSNLVTLSFWERVKYTYLKISRRFCMAISNALYQYTDYAQGASLFSEVDKACIKDFYLQSNAEFWSQNDLLNTVK
jgi:hypothetical protein